MRKALEASARFRTAFEEEVAKIERAIVIEMKVPRERRQSLREMQEMQVHFRDRNCKKVLEARKRWRYVEDRRRRMMEMLAEEVDTKRLVEELNIQKWSQRGRREMQNELPTHR